MPVCFASGWMCVRCMLCVRLLIAFWCMLCVGWMIVCDVHAVCSMVIVLKMYDCV